MSEKMEVQEISLKRRVQKSFIWFGGTRIIGQAISWFITAYVARILSPSDYGLLGMSMIFTGLVVIVNELGLGIAIIQKKNLAEEDLSNVFWIVTSVNIGVYLIFALTAPLIAIFFKEPRIASIIRISTLEFIIACTGYISYYMLTRNMAFDKRSQAEFIANLLGGCSTLLFALNGFGVWSLVYGNIILQLTRNSLFLFFYPWLPSFSFSFHKMKKMMNFGVTVTIYRILGYGYSNADFLIAGRMLGKTLLGYYTLAFQFASIPIEKIIAIITQVTLPAFSEIQSDKELLERYFLKMVRIAAFITFPIFLGIFLVADDLVNLVLTDKWAPMILPLKILCIVSIFRGINSLNAIVLIAKGRPDVPMLNNLIYAAVLPIAFYIGSLYGLKGISYSWLFAFPPLFIVTTYLSLKVLDISMLKYSKELIKFFLGALFMAVSVIIFQKLFLYNFNHINKILLTTTIGMLSYLLYYILFNIETIVEAKSLLRR